MSKHINQWSYRLLRWFCPPDLLEEIEGDLMQRFERDVKTFGVRKAKRRLLWNTIRFLRPAIILRNKFSYKQNQLLMFKNYFTTSLRHIRKSKVNFAFKLGGLTLALFSFLVIAIYVSFQLSFDKFHQHYENIYRVNSSWFENDKEVKCASVPSATGAALKAEFPDVEAYSIISEWGHSLIRYKDDLKLFRTGSFIEAESSVFDVFTFQFISGDKNALVRPGGIVVTETLAHQIFGDEDPMYKLISFPDEHNRILEVRAVIEDLPPNSSLKVKAIIGYGALRDSGDGDLYSWNIDYGGNLFVRLRDQANVKDFQEKLKPLFNRNLPKTYDGREAKFKVFLQPLTNIYMGEALRWELERKGNSMYLFIYISLAVFLLTIASINYLNLSIADFSFRNKEIGVRKVLGARKKQIVFQITFETIFCCLLALLLSIGVLYILFPKVSDIVDFNLTFSMMFSSEVIVWVVITLFVLILASSAYPAYSLAVNNPIHDLKKKQIIGGKLSVNKVLLLAQFAIAAFCICATWVVGSQVQYIQTKDIGFNRNNLLEIFMPYRYPVEKAHVFKEEVNKLANVVSTSFSYYHITGIPYFNAWYKIESGNEMKQILLNEIFADEDFIRTMGLTLVEGRNFNSKNEFKSAFIVNETAVKEFGWEQAIGKKIAVGHDKDEGGIWSEGTVIGVVKDFNTRSLHSKVEPVVIRLQYDEWPGNHLNVKYTGSEKDIIASLRKVYEKVLPGFLINYDRVSEQYENQYIAENKAYSTLKIATWIILLISCIGIFSMSLFMSFKRQKEFGIRKVVGATVTQIATLHVGYFLKIAFIANLFVIPLVYYVMHVWLNEFAYRTEVTSWLFVSLAGVILLLVVISASYSAFKAGRMNPVDVIKIE